MSARFSVNKKLILMKSIVNIYIPQMKKDFLPPFDWLCICCRDPVVTCHARSEQNPCAYLHVCSPSALKWSSRLNLAGLDYFLELNQSNPILSCLILFRNIFETLSIFHFVQNSVPIVFLGFLIAVLQRLVSSRRRHATFEVSKIKQAKNLHVIVNCKKSPK